METKIELRNFINHHGWEETKEAIAELKDEGFIE